MKKIYFALVIVMLFFVQAVTAQSVNIPDANFKAALVQNLDINTNGDEEIQVAEAEAFTGDINIGARDIYDLTGIEAFTGITLLFCNSNHLTSLDLSKNTALLALFCSDNQLTSLDVSNNTLLSTLYCQTNKIEILDIQNNIELTQIYCSDNLLSTLDITGLSHMIYLNCSSNLLENLFTANPSLYTLNCAANKLTSLDVSSNTSLIIFDCGSNQLTAINVSNNNNLKNFSCYHNFIKNISFNGNAALEVLNCSINQLTSLDLSANSNLQSIGCGFNPITSLSLSSNPHLILLDCNYAQLSNLDLSANPELQGLYCQDNQLTSLNLKNGHNINLAGFVAIDNPNLTCILVDDPTYMNTNWSSAKDATASYSMSCGCTTPTITTDPAITSDLCSGTSVKLTASAASSYLWSTGATNKSITKKKAGSYTVTTTNTITGCTATSDPVIVTYQTCTTPANISTSDITASSATFNFTGNACAEKYVIEYHPKGTPTWIVIDSVYASPYTIYGLSPGTKYEYRMRTICSTSPLRQSNYSVKSTFTTSPSFMQNQSLINKSQINSSFNISLSPNPASTNVKLQISGNKTDIAITITDMLGKVVWQLSHVTTQQINLPVENFAKGVYLVVVNNGKEIKQLKLVKE